MEHEYTIDEQYTNHPQVFVDQSQIADDYVINYEKINEITSIDWGTDER